uniref:SAM domain-containing protein n=1 Tax=Anopheles atroparvus TaxID=41427 RepID=A0A182JAM9_ANOAO
MAGAWMVQFRTPEEVSGRESEQTAGSAATATAADGGSDAQLNGTGSSTPMDTTPAPGGNVVPAPATSTAASTGTDATATSSVASKAAPSFQSMMFHFPAGLSGITSVSSAPGATTTTSVSSTIASVSSASTATSTTASLASSGATSEPSSAPSTVSTASLTSSASSTATTNSTTTMTSTGGGEQPTSAAAVAASTTSTTTTGGTPTTAIAAITGTSAIPVSNIGANGVLSTGASVVSAGTTTTTSTSSSSPGLPPPVQTKAGSNGDKGGIPKATIKPNVLTHVIEGFVIQEADEPFAVQRQRYPERDNSDEPPKKRATNEGNSPLSPSSQSADGSGNCEVCGKSELRSKIKRKRFCSVSCARSVKQNSTDQISSPVQNGTPGTPGLPLGGTLAVQPGSNGTATADPSMVGSMNGLLATAAPAAVVVPAVDSSSLGQLQAHAAAAAANAEEGSSILRWSVQDVYEFIRGLPGCSDYAEDFVNQEIDGQALLLLKENHLVSTMDMKLGPALKIVARVNLMKTTIAGGVPEGQQQQQGT